MILSSNQLSPFFQQWGPVNEDKLKQLKESKIDLNETEIGWQKEVELKKMATVMQHLNFSKLDKMEEKVRVVSEAKINEMRADKNLRVTSMKEKNKTVIWILHWIEI